MQSQSINSTYFFQSEKVNGGGCVYAEIRQAHIVLLFFQYFTDLSFLIISNNIYPKSGHKYVGRTYKRMINQERSLIGVPRKVFQKKVCYLIVYFINLYH